MFPEQTIVIFYQYAIQALFALVVFLILKKFYREYENNHFKYWGWSWLAMIFSLVATAISLSNIFIFSLTHPFRILTSVLAICGVLIQVFWLYAGSYELSRKKTLNSKRILLLSLLSIPVAMALVLAYINQPEAANMRIMLRVGVKSLISGIAFIASSILLLRLKNTGIGIKFIIIAFLFYGLEQFNYFIDSISFLFNIDYPLSAPYYFGIVDVFLQTMMGIGMVISMLELERHQLKKANNELDTFLYRSSHDLRAPLTTISGIVSAMKMTDDPRQQEEFMNAIQGRLDQADNVIRDIITLRQGQKMDVNLTEVDLVDELKREFETLTGPVKVRPTLKLTTNGDNFLKTDPARLHTILTNLFTNSIKYHDYSKESPFIHIEIIRSEKGVNMTFEDNGPGIDEKHLPKIFDMFYRANKSSYGTGLGLYLVKDALSHIGGTIEVSSVKGKGTTFGLYFPNQH